MTQIIGHALQRDRLKDLFFSGRLPQSMGFSGQAGTGKLLVARELCRTLVCETAARSLQARSPDLELYGGCSNCAACHLFDHGNFPDFHQIECLGREDASVAKIRELLHVTNMKAFAGSTRTVVFNNAEQLSVQACNILLKSLEEPRPDTYFVLVTANHSRIPPTLISRCQMWYFDRLSVSDIESVLNNRRRNGDDKLSTYSEATLNEVALLADGSLDNIDNILADLPWWDRIRQALDALESGNMEDWSELVRESSKEKQSLRGKLAQMRIYSRQKLLQEEGASTRKLWSVFVSNIIEAEYLIFDRNLSAAYVLNAAVLDFISESTQSFFTSAINDVSLVHKMVV